MRKWIITIVSVLLIGLWAYAVAAGWAERDVYIKQHKYILKIAAEDFAKYGYVTNVSSSDDQFWLSSNVVSIAGTRYQCYAEIGGGEFGDKGTLAVTTNQVFIWLGSNQQPKIIDAGYKPPLFGLF